MFVPIAVKPLDPLLQYWEIREEDFLSNSSLVEITNVTQFFKPEPISKELSQKCYS